jgi:hypothetical protein
MSVLSCQVNLMCDCIYPVRYLLYVSSGDNFSEQKAINAPVLCTAIPAFD